MCSQVGVGVGHASSRGCTHTGVGCVMGTADEDAVHVPAQGHIKLTNVHCMVSCMGGEVRGLCRATSSWLMRSASSLAWVVRMPAKGHIKLTDAQCIKSCMGGAHACAGPHQADRCIVHQVLHGWCACLRRATSSSPTHSTSSLAWVVRMPAQGNIVLTNAQYEVLTLLRSHRDDDKGFAVMARHPYPMQHVRLRQVGPAAAAAGCGSGGGGGGGGGGGCCRCCWLP